MSAPLKLFLAFVALILVIYIALIFDIPYADKPDSFETCVALGYTITESHPRQCGDKNGILFVETINNTL